MNGYDRRRELTAEYKGHYNRGWRTSTTATGEGGSALDRADGKLRRLPDGSWARGEADAWYDGYMDAAAGRPKWHLPKCAAHHNDPGGCGEA